EKDNGEPAWGAVARMLRETRFVQVFRRLYFMKHMWSVPVEDYWNEVREEIAGHRYAPFLETKTTARDAQAKVRQFAERLDLADVEMTEHDMNRSLWGLGRPRDRAAWSLALAHEDETASMETALWWIDDVQSKPGIARQMLAYSPFHAFARHIL